MLKYRSEIDGLRALAVVPVILFHAGFKVFSGGFVGVDVFFVISGYLITTILINEMEAKKFSLLQFYERRARRILPALFLVMLACLPPAWFWLLPQDMRSFSQSLVAVSVFSSNILFWRTSGYFESATELKPLLHTWSLSVEEQYYVLFPLFLMLSWKLGKRWVLGMLVVAALMSLALAQWGAYTFPAFAYYMLPTRAWELMIGAFVAFYYSNHNIRKHGRRASEFGSLLGFALIGYSIFAFNDRTPFPGLYAVVPTLGAALIIIFATPSTLVGRLLSTKPFLWTGLISYSAYLWHQPLLAFARQRSLDNPEHGWLLPLLACLTLPLAYLTWRFVERPFRNKHRISRKTVFGLTVVCSAAFFALGLIGHVTKGLPEVRLAKDQADFLSHFENSTPEWKFSTKMDLLKKYREECNFYDLDKYRNGNSTNIPRPAIDKSCYSRDGRKPKSVFIWGDSHAEQLNAGLSTALPAEWQILQVASSACPAKLGASASTINYCEQSNWFAYKSIRETMPDVVVIAQSQGHDITHMATLAEALKSIGIKRIVFVGPVPLWNRDLPTIAAHLWGSVPAYTSIGLDRNTLEVDKKISASYPSDDRSTYVSAIRSFCKDASCQIYIGDDLKAGITSWDHGHLTPIASEKFARDALAPQIVGDGLRPIH
ncbi:hypothetical protein CDL60_04125 [Roseateles noduli]|nr:hypothetical protein CDL60_04125 [Roseateles noduli]